MNPRLGIPDLNYHERQFVNWHSEHESANHRVANSTDKTSDAPNMARKMPKEQFKPEISLKLRFQKQNAFACVALRTKEWQTCDVSANDRT
jgi:hypothetical protein